jgi:hypothetical protein
MSLVTLFIQTCQHEEIMLAVEHYNARQAEMAAAREAYFQRRTENRRRAYQAAVTRLSWAKDRLREATVL